MGQKGQIYEMPMPDARCQDSEISAAVPRPRIRENSVRHNPSVGVAACKADLAGILRA